MTWRQGCSPLTFLRITSATGPLLLIPRTSTRCRFKGLGSTRGSRSPWSLRVSAPRIFWLIPSSARLLRVTRTLSGCSILRKSVCMRAIASHRRTEHSWSPLRLNSNRILVRSLVWSHSFCSSWCSYSYAHVSGLLLGCAFGRDSLTKRIWIYYRISKGIQIGYRYSKASQTNKGLISWSASFKKSLMTRG